MDFVFSLRSTHDLSDFGGSCWIWDIPTFSLWLAITLSGKIQIIKTVWPLKRKFQGLQNKTNRDILSFLVWKLRPFKGMLLYGGRWIWDIPDFSLWLTTALRWTFISCHTRSSIGIRWETSSFEQRCVQRKGLRLNCWERFVRFCQICQICRFRFVRFVRFADFRDLKKTRDGPTDGRTDRWTDRPSYRDAWTHQKGVYEYNCVLHDSNGCH